MSPEIDIGADADIYHRTAMLWLAGVPGDTTTLSDQEHDDLMAWIGRYQLRLMNAKQESPALGEDRLVLASAALGGAIFGSAAIGTMVARMPGPLLVSVGLALLTAGYAVAAVLKNTRKRRRFEMIDTVYRQLDTILETARP